MPSSPPHDTALDHAPSHSNQYVDNGWDDLGDDPIEDYTGRAGRLRDEDGSW